MTPGLSDLPGPVLHRLAARARHLAPQEACALLYRQPGQTGWQIRPVRNLSATPQHDFAVAADQLAATRKGAEVILFHSHPAGPPWPSFADMAGQAETGLPWLIADLSGPQADFFLLGGAPPPLARRAFRHGVTDCYALIRDIYADRLGVCLPDWPRDWLWWQSGQRYYETLFARTGFRALRPDEPPRPLDVCLMRIRATTANHAAVLCEDGCLHHHLAGRYGYDPARLPRRDPAPRWAPFIQVWLRWTGWSEPAVLNRKA